MEMEMEMEIEMVTAGRWLVDKNAIYQPAFSIIVL